MARLKRDASLAKRIPAGTIDLLSRGIAQCTAEHDPPVARIAANVAQPAQYAQARYFFDIAIYYRGVVEFHRAFPSADWARIEARLDEWVQRFIHPVDDVHAVLDGVSPGTGWSWQVGPHQAKAAGHLLRVAADRVIRPGWYASVERVHQRLRASVPDDRYPSHPFAYWYEGCLALDVLSAPIDPLTNRYVPARGMPEAIGSDVFRVDALAQSLRLAIHTALRDRDPASWRAACREYARTLTTVVQADGAVPFAMERADQGGNTWCALFAWQALTMFDHLEQGRMAEVDLPDSWI